MDVRESYQLAASLVVNKAAIGLEVTEAGRLFSGLVFKQTS